MTERAAVIRHTKNWLSSVVIAHNLCPFAKREFDLGRIQYEVIEAQETERQLEALILQCAAMDAKAELETSLLIFPNALDDFEDYLDMLDLAAALMSAQGYDGIYQLASFHPQYRFDTAPDNDPSHYTNRSPYPMLHILRETSVEAVLKTYPNPEKIPERNIELTQKLGAQAMKGLFAACYK